MIPGLDEPWQDLLAGYATQLIGTINLLTDGYVSQVNLLCRLFPAEAEQIRATANLAFTEARQHLLSGRDRN